MSHADYCQAISLPRCHSSLFFFFFNDTASTEIYTLSLHDALPISLASSSGGSGSSCECPNTSLASPSGKSSIRTIWTDDLPDGDRKSTRLNSSHSQISYAVFCLKKKKKQKNKLKIQKVANL